jgi:DNA-binding response OmpR family regulator
LPASVLVLDNEPDIVNVVKAMLKKGGYSVDSFLNLDDALAAFKSKKYDLVVLDFKLGNNSTNGFEVYERMREMDSSIKVLFFSGDSNHYAQYAERYPASHSRKYIHKPVTMAKLLDQVDVLLRQ